MATRCFYQRREEGFDLANDSVRLTYTIDRCIFQLTFPGSDKPATKDCGMEFRLYGRMYTHEDLCTAAATIHEAETDGQTVVTVARTFGTVTVRQIFLLRVGAPYVLMKLELEGQDIISSNYLCPLYIQGTVFPLPHAVTPRLLYVPYDNDKWGRYKAQELQTCGTSYEFTVIYDDHSCNGYVVGSVTHDQWKTGITTHGGYGELSTLRIFGGAADANTRDPYQPHGKVRGKVISSPVVMAGYYADFREGMRAYGQVCASYCPAPQWQEGVIFGWNSWACLTTHICFDAFAQVSKTFASWQSLGYENHGTVYVNFDSFWDRLTPEELRASVELCHAHGQKAGIYYTPFTCWHKRFDQVVEGTNGQYTYRDILLRDENDQPIPPIAGGYPIDPTHPGNIMRVDAAIRRFIDLGFDYLKVDFMSHGACEGVHYRHEITTGIAAYHYGLQAMCRQIQPEVLGRPFFLDFSIAPLFPHGYANARRISCDSFGQIYDTEYMLNALTYSFWQNGTIYNYTDPDHTCLYQSVGRPVSTVNEARSRLLASCIAGTVLLLSDDYRTKPAAERTQALLTPEFLEIAREGKAFLPVECHDGEKASRFFYRQDAGRIYLAAFNFHPESATLTLPVARIGTLPEHALFTNADGSMHVQGPVLEIALAGCDCVLLHCDLA